MKEDDLFPGFRSYLAERFGPEAGAAALEPIARNSADVKRGGYGIPCVVRWRTASGERRLVLETVRPGEFGHEDRADRAALVVRAFDETARSCRGTSGRWTRASSGGAAPPPASGTRKSSSS